MSEASLMFGWFGIIFMCVFGIVLVGLVHLESKGKVRLKMGYIYAVIGSIIAVGIWFIFSKTINTFFF
ncbi:hypothetical protein [Virgibacillus necropolis]|uniref:Uncharacterized protein n=1 Tax=Virgibacillus necropolis TaxID=163877 RepID=A0A221MCC5_9BACI|nr:hypothetical protein [Virgibacillus necropolis]ASN05316.1 hypothetical protein CFK40_09970 [Virgibacillus necropolis]